jgi:hypothetical protein
MFILVVEKFSFSVSGKPSLHPLPAKERKEG